VKLSQHLVQQESLIQSQIPGRSSQLLDDRFGFSSSSKATTGGGTGLGVAAAGKPKLDAEGPKTMALSQELIMEIFEEFPIVQRIYVDNVGGENGVSFALTNCSLKFPAFETLMEFYSPANSSPRRNSGSGISIQRYGIDIELLPVQIRLQLVQEKRGRNMTTYLTSTWRSRMMVSSPSCMFSGLETR
jgi:hypothetical protein